MEVKTAVSIPIERDGESVGALRFDPSDVLFMERIYDLMDRFEALNADYTRRAQALEAEDGPSVGGVPPGARARLALLRELCEAMYGALDGVFGAGTSAMVFGDCLSPDAVAEFLAQLTPKVDEVREERMKRYVGRKGRKVLRK